MSLGIVYRPKTFEEVIGNKNTINSLQTIINSINRPHSFLFIGPSGCGKTTLARIVAKELGCIGLDYVELNSASFRGMDTARDIISQMNMRPLMGKVRVWLIDEVHQMTKDAQSALLKALEDTPKHTYFLLATTEPQKLLPTVRNRCTQFQVSPLAPEKIRLLLDRVCLKEKKKVKESILEKIARDCEGCPREALNTLNKIIDMDSDKQEKAAKQFSIEHSETIDLCRALLGKKSWQEVSKILKGLKEVDVEGVRLAVLGYANSVLLNQINPRAFLILDSFKDPWYNAGHAGLTRSCFEVVMNK